MIRIDELGVPVFILDQLLMIKEIREVYTKYSSGSIEYCILFGWEASPFMNVREESERHEFVMTELELGGWCPDVSHIKRTHGNFYQKEAVKEAISVINKVFNVPLFEQVEYYKKQIDSSRSMIEQLGELVRNGEKEVVEDENGRKTVISKTEPFDAATISKYATAQKGINEQIEILFRKVDDLSKKIANAIRSKEECGLDYFIKK